MSLPQNKEFALSNIPFFGMETYTRLSSYPTLIVLYRLSVQRGVRADTTSLVE